MSPPLVPTHRMFLTQSVTLAVHIVTTAVPTSSPALLFLPLWGGTMNTYRHLIPHFSSCCNLILPTLRGWSASTGPVETTEYKITDYASDVKLLVTKLDRSLFEHGLVLVGHSMGGKIAQFLAALAGADQESLIGGVELKGVVLLAPAPIGSLVLPEDMRVQQRTAYTSGYDVADSVVRNVLLGSDDGIGADEIELLVHDVLSGTDAATRGWIDYGMVEDGKPLLDRMQARLRLLVITGLKDIVEPTKRVEKEVVTLWKDAGHDISMKSLDGAGHLLAVETTSEVANTIKGFLGVLG